MADIRVLRQRALHAVEKANWTQALELYETLGREDRNEPSWPLRAGEMCRKLGRPRDAAAALGRAVELYSKSGHLLKAIAVCKTILEIEPAHTTAQEKLAALHGAARPVRPSTAPRLPVRAAATPAPPLDTLSLARLLPDARPTDVVPTLS